MSRKMRFTFLIVTLFVFCIGNFSFAQPVNGSESVSNAIFLDESSFYYEVPEGFNPITATDEELSKYGIYERPMDPKELEQWNKDMAGAKWVRPVIEDTPDHISPSSKLKLRDSTSDESIVTTDPEFSTNSYNWCGIVYGSPSFGAKTRVIVPSVYASLFNRPAYCGQWAGTGGVTYEKLAQLGLCEYVNSSGTAIYYAWYETIGTDVDNSAHQLANFSVSPGDDIFISMWLETYGNGFNIYYYYHNYTTNVYSTVIVYITSFAGIASTGEWIFERPFLGQDYSKLARPTLNGNYQAIFTQCGYKDSNAVWHSGSGSQYDIYTYRTVATASAMSSESFTATWHNYN